MKACERDASSTHETMARRYNRWHLRFDQPDPYDGSYDLTDPQSLNRYSYVEGDPVNLIDPSGLMTCYIDGSLADCNSAFGLTGSGAGVGISGPVDRFRYNPQRHTWEELRVYVDTIGYVPPGAIQRGPLLWGWTDLSDEPYPSYSYTLALLPPRSLRRIGRSGYSIDYLDFHRFLRKADVDRRMAEGNRLDRQREWDICAAAVAAPIQEAYEDEVPGLEAQRNVKAGIGIVTLGTAFATKLMNPIVGIGVTGVQVQQAVQERSTYNKYRAKFLREAQRKCGTRP